MALALVLAGSCCCRCGCARSGRSRLLVERLHRADAQHAAAAADLSDLLRPAAARPLSVRVRLRRGRHRPAALRRSWSRYYRGGIESVSQRQWEAARAIGMSRLTAFRHVILPQAVLRVLGPIGNQLIVLVKDTSLVSAIGRDGAHHDGQGGYRAKLPCRSRSSSPSPCSTWLLTSLLGGGLAASSSGAPRGGSDDAQRPVANLPYLLKGAVVTLWLSADRGHARQFARAAASASSGVGWAPVAQA